MLIQLGILSQSNKRSVGSRPATSNKLFTHRSTLGWKQSSSLNWSFNPYGPFKRPSIQSSFLQLLDFQSLQKIFCHASPSI